MSKDSPQLSLDAKAARNLATATVTVPQWTQITPRWLHKLLPWVDVDGGVYRVNRVAKKNGIESETQLLTVNSGEPKLPASFVDYDVDPREYHLKLGVQVHSLTHDGQRYFGLMEIRGRQTDEDYCRVLGLRNSHDKTFPAGIVAGASVFVCDNL